MRVMVDSDVRIECGGEDRKERNKYGKTNRIYGVSETSDHSRVSGG